MRHGKRTIAGLALGAVALIAFGARADEVDDYNRKLIDLDQRVVEMLRDFKGEEPPPPDIADRRVLDAEVLFDLKNYEEAATILLDVVEKYPNSRAYDDAVYLLGEALFQARDYYPSRQYFELSIKKQTNSKSEQQALQRLIEIAQRTGDYEHIDEYLARLQNVPANLLEPSVPYVRAKYYFFRDNAEQATAGFSAIGPENPYYLQARYFLGTLQVKAGDLENATVTFDAITKLKAADDNGREVQDLARMALGRILYERSQFDRAIEAYQSVDRQSRHFSEALYEVAWTHIKAKQWQQAWRKIDLLLLSSPDTSDAPELRLLMGNLHLRMNTFALASEAFSKARDDFEPVHRQLQADLIRSQQDPGYFDNLVGKNLDKFDISVFLPPGAAKWAKSDPAVDRMLTLANDIGDLQRALKESNQILVKIERAIETPGAAGIFPDLAAQRAKSIEVMNQLVEARQRFVRKTRDLLSPRLSAEERAQLDRIATERDSLEQRLKTLPLTREALKAREDELKKHGEALDAEASELNVQIQGLEAQLVAIEQYYRTSRNEQKIRPEDIEGPVRDLRTTLDELHTMHDKVRDDIAEVMRQSTTAGGAGEEERKLTARLGELLHDEQQIQSRAKYKLPGDQQMQVDRMSGVLARVDAVEKNLRQFDQRIDAQVAKRLEKVRGYLAAEKEELDAAGGKLTAVVGESQSVGGGLAQAMFGKVAERFYDLVVRSDVGIIDVAWGLKDEKTQAATKLTAQKSLELKAVEEDFKKLLEDDK